MASQRSRMEQAKALRVLKGITTSDSEFEALAKALFPTPDPSRDRALEGLSQEDEFAILCRLMGTCTHIARLDQAPLLERQDSIVPDYLASFSPGFSSLGLSPKAVGCTYKCFIEVKSDDKKKYKISERDLKRREDFCHHFGQPLVFALRFKQYQGAAWLLVTSQQFRDFHRTLDMTQMLKGIGHLLLDDYTIAAPNAFDVVYTWDTNATVGGIRHDKYGVVVQVDLLEKNSRVPVRDLARDFVCLFLEPFLPEILSTSTTGTRTMQLLRIPGNQARSISSLVYFCNRIRSDATTGEAAYDAVRITSSFDSPKPHLTLFTRELIEYVALEFFLKPRRLFKIALGSPEDELARLKGLSKHHRTK
jgi:hypothetical protein